MITSASYDRKLNVGLLLSLEFKEGTGTKTQDWSKTAHHPATLVSAPTWSSISGQPFLIFAADPDYVSITNAASADLGFTTEDFTIATWFYAAYADGQIMSRGGWGTNGYEIYFMNTGVIYFYTATGGNAYLANTAGNFWPANTWCLLVFSRTGTANRYVYLNGQRKPATYTGVANNPGATADNFMVACDNSLTFGGNCRQAKFRVWNRVLMPEEVMFLYQTERRLFSV